MVGPQEVHSDFLSRSLKPTPSKAPQSDLVTRNLAMEGGEGEDSYASNSRVQAVGFLFVQSKLEDAISRMDLPPKDLLRIADLGCSSGPNTVTQMNLMVRSIKTKYRSNPGFPIPEFQVYFVDLLSNDFNSLFRLVDKNRRAKTLSTASISSDSDYFWTGVAGSFYGRLLPRQSLDVVFSSFSLHWLSKIPDEVQRPGSKAYNNGFVWIHGGKAEVGKQYALQAKSDMCDFLRARAEEMVSGGLMCLLLKGRKDSDPTLQYDASGTTMFGMHMEQIFTDLILEGHLKEEVRDSFNVPIYYRTVEEMKEALDEVGEFIIKRVDLLDDVPGNPSTQAELQASPTDCGRRVAKICRSLLGVFIESHMGKDAGDEFFKKLEQRAIQRSEAEAQESRVLKLHVNLAVLVRK